MRPPVAVLTLWLSLVALSAWWTRAHPGAQPPPTCLFRRLTGVACPTCGSTRAVLALGELDVPKALALNPLVTLLALGLPVIVLLRARARGGVRPPGAVARALGARGGAMLAAIALLALGVNWWWVLARGG